MANRHKGKGGREQQFGNKEVFASAKKGTVKGAIFKQDGGPVVGKAAGGRLDKRARGGRTGGGSSPFSSAAFARGGSVTGGNRRG